MVSLEAVMVHAEVMDLGHSGAKSEELRLVAVANAELRRLQADLSREQGAGMV